MLIAIKRLSILGVYLAKWVSWSSTEKPIFREEIGNTACIPIYLEDLLLAGQIKFGVLISHNTHAKRLRVFGSDHGLE